MAGVSFQYFQKGDRLGLCSKVVRIPCCRRESSARSLITLMNVSDQSNLPETRKIELKIKNYVPLKRKVQPYGRGEQFFKT